ncbi:hypothetical protein IWZ00DRAFT_560623 [Phyllosticta capitalensis]
MLPKPNQTWEVTGAVKLPLNVYLNSLPSSSFTLLSFGLFTSPPSTRLTAIMPKRRRLGSEGEGCDQPLSTSATLEPIDENDLESLREFSLSQLLERIQDLQKRIRDLEKIIELKDEDLKRKDVKDARIQSNLDDLLGPATGPVAKYTTQRKHLQPSDFDYLLGGPLPEITMQKKGRQQTKDYNIQGLGTGPVSKTTTQKRYQQQPDDYDDWCSWLIGAPDALENVPKSLEEEAQQWSRKQSKRVVTAEPPKKPQKLQDQTSRIVGLESELSRLRAATTEASKQKDEQIQEQTSRIRDLESELGRLRDAMAGMGQMTHGALVHRRGQQE